MDGDHNTHCSYVISELRENNALSTSYLSTPDAGFKAQASEARTRIRKWRCLGPRSKDVRQLLQYNMTYVRT